DGALPWAWAAVKPLYLQGMPDQAAASFWEEAIVVPVLKSLAGEEPASVDAVLGSYDHSNTISLFALGALVAGLRRQTAATGTPETGPRLRAPDVALPKLASAEDVMPETWACVLRLNRFGDRPEPLILASMYRHLAHAPTFLERIETALTPVEADGSLRLAIDLNRGYARGRAAVLARAILAARPDKEVEIETGVSAFVDHAIAKMVTICRSIRVARGQPL
ncbi:MAG: hypothetical protein K9G48_13320, partial [Reyranella sp.]|nr:hypothetical protein [Reyranella sp.]